MYYHLLAFISASELKQCALIGMMLLTKRLNYMYTYIRKHIHIYVCMYVCMYVCTYLHNILIQ